MKRLTITVEYDESVEQDRVVALASQASADAHFLYDALTSDEYYGFKVPCRVTLVHDGVTVSERTYRLSDFQARGD